MILNPWLWYGWGGGDTQAIQAGGNVVTKKKEENVGQGGIGNTQQITKQLTYSPTSNVTKNISDSRSWQRTITNAPVDARSLTLTIDSPYAQTTSKKDVSSMPFVMPSIDQRPSFDTQQEGAETEQSSSQLAMGGMGELLLYAGVGVLAYGGYKYLKKKKARKK